MNNQILNDPKPESLWHASQGLGPSENVLHFGQNYFKDGKGYLSYSFNEGKSYGGMGWSQDQIKNISTIIGVNNFEKLIAGEYVVISSEQFKEVQPLWFSTRYKKYKDIHVPVEADMDLVKFIYDAYKNDNTVMVTYGEDFAMYPSDEEMMAGAVVSDDGLTHLWEIGKTTGVSPVLISLEVGGGDGGGEFCYDHIKSAQIIGTTKYYRAKKEEVLFPELTSSYTREQMIDAMVKDDINSIRESMTMEDTGFLESVLRGNEGWSQYAALDDTAILEEFNDRNSDGDLMELMGEEVQKRATKL